MHEYPVIVFTDQWNIHISLTLKKMYIAIFMGIKCAQRNTICFLLNHLYTSAVFMSVIMRTRPIMNGGNLQKSAGVIISHGASSVVKMCTPVAMVAYGQSLVKEAKPSAIQLDDKIVDEAKNRILIMLPDSIQICHTCRAEDAYDKKKKKISAF